jgi:hypothetical protein
MKTNSFIYFVINVLFQFPFMVYGQPPDSLWQHHYGGAGDEIAFDVAEGDDGVYYVAGYTESYGNGNNDAYILEIDPSGNLVWDENYGVAAGSEIIYGSCLTSDGGIILAGKTDYYYDVEDEVLVLKLGVSSSGAVEENAQGPLLAVLPNPVVSKANICFDIPGKNDIFLSVYDSYGRKCNRSMACGLCRESKMFPGTPLTCRLGFISYG